MRTKTGCPSLVSSTALAMLLAVLNTAAAPIPGLYNTGVDNAGNPLPAKTKDPHYTLVVSADPNAPGPDAFTLQAGFPVPPWLAEGPNSRWIAPQASQAAGNAPGDYTYRTTFDLTGYDHTKATLIGRWTSDNFGTDILLNGVSQGLTQGGNFGALEVEFTITAGFVAAINTLEFVVNNAGDAVNPTGLRVEVRGTVELPNEPPSIVQQPTGATVVVGDDVSLTVVADGTPPLAYQWKRNGANIDGAIEATYAITGVALDQAGDYTVVISNTAGTQTSAAATVTVLEPIAGLFNTGVTDEGLVLDDLTVDPHYQLVVNPDGESTDALVEDSTVFPIAAGPWLLNSDTSKWIGPRGETSAAAGGDYTYRLTFNLTGFDPTTAFISGRFSSDNAAPAVLLNGAPTGITFDGNFAALSPVFRIAAGFVSGANTLDFRINNASAGYTGLRVDGLRGGAKKGQAPGAPRIVAEPVDVVAVIGELVKFTVVADGQPTLTYQWKFNNASLAGQTDSTLTLSGVALADAGLYQVTVSNSLGSKDSASVRLTVLERVPGMFNTGVDALGTVLADGEVDPHYKLVVNPDGGGQDALVQDSTVFPISDGTWFRNSDVSKWIGPRFETSAAAAGDYVYRVTFDLSGFDATTAVLQGGWATDNQGNDIKLNGASLGLLNVAQFPALTPFKISGGFQAGINTLEFEINNASEGYTGLRLEGLRLGARRLPTPPSLRIDRAGVNVTLSWPAAAAAYQLKATKSLTTPNWLEVNAPVKIEGDRRTVTVPASEAAEFFRLQHESAGR